MQDTESNSTQSLIDKYYQEEQERRLQEKTQAEISVKIEPADLAMLNMIARRFSKSRDEITRDVMSTALIDLFSRLESGERKLLARDADEATRQLAEEIAEENGVTDVDIRQGQWTTHEKNIVKLERKRAREQEKQQELLASAQKVLDQTATSAVTSKVTATTDTDAADESEELSAEGMKPSNEAEATSVFSAG
jgi:hypothetical protein